MKTFTKFLENLNEIYKKSDISKVINYHAKEAEHHKNAIETLTTLSREYGDSSSYMKHINSLVKFHNEKFEHHNDKAYRGRDVRDLVGAQKELKQAKEKYAYLKFHNNEMRSQEKNKKK